MKRALLVAFLALLIFLSIALLIFPGFFRGKGLFLKFDRVDNFSKPASIITIFRNEVSIVDVSYSKGPSLKKTLFFDSNDFHRFRNIIAACPDGSKFFIGSNDKLTEFEPSGKVIREITLSSLGFDGYQFGNQAQASNDYLWFSIDDKVIEWNLHRDPNTRLIGPDCFVWSVDPSKRRIFLRGMENGIFSFENMLFKEKKWDEYGLFSDFIEDKGLLFSNILAPGKGYRGIFINLDNGKSQELPWGAQAQWGSDGYIYFIRGNSQLWRYKIGQNKPEPVYLATRMPQGGKEGSLNVLKMSYDRTLIAFYFWKPSKQVVQEYFNPNPKRYGLVLIDLENHECIEISGEDIWSFIENMAWLTKPKMLEEN